MNSSTNISEQYMMLLDRLRLSRSRLASSLLKSQQVRDLTVLQLLGDLLLVVAVDSDGAIGPKEDDVVKVDGYLCGRFGTRVPLMEILACDAIPIAAFDALAVEMKPLGEEIIRGMRDELLSVGLPADFPISGSTEDNVPTKQTGMGIVILGMVEQKAFRPGSSKSGDEVFLVGTPKSGPADVVDIEDHEIATGVSVIECSRIDGVNDILPVGSKGVLHEANELAGWTGLSFTPKTDLGVNVRKSAGPSTCFVVSGSPGVHTTARHVLKQPVTLIGSLQKK